MKLSLKKSYKKLVQASLLAGIGFLLFACSPGGGGGAAVPLPGAGSGGGLGLPGGGPGGNAAPGTTEVAPYGSPDPVGQKFYAKTASMSATAECAPDVTNYKFQMSGTVQITSKSGWVDCPGGSCNDRALAIIDGQNYMIVHTGNAANFVVEGFSSGPGRGLNFYFFPIESGDIPAGLEFDKMLNCPSSSWATCLPGGWLSAASTFTTPNHCCGVQCAD